MQGFFGVHTDVRHRVSENQIISSLPHTKVKFENAVGNAGYLVLCPCLKSLQWSFQEVTKCIPAINHKLHTVRVDFHK